MGREMLAMEPFDFRSDARNDDDRCVEDDLCAEEDLCCDEVLCADEER